MAGRGPQTFHKRQKEQQRKEKRLEKLERRLQRNQAAKTAKETGVGVQEDDDLIDISEIVQMDDFPLGNQEPE